MWLEILTGLQLAKTFFDYNTQNERDKLQETQTLQRAKQNVMRQNKNFTQVLDDLNLNAAFGVDPDSGSLARLKELALEDQKYNTQAFRAKLRSDINKINLNRESRNFSLFSNLINSGLLYGASLSKAQPPSINNTAGSGFKYA